MIRREDKWKKWRRKEEERPYSNFKHDEVVVWNNDILINGKVVVEDIIGGENERREMEEMEEGRRRRCETPENPDSLRNDKLVNSVKIQNFSRSQMTKRTSLLESSC